jgi:lipopolysaccharide transport system permease protein
MGLETVQKVLQASDPARPDKSRSSAGAERGGEASILPAVFHGSEASSHPASSLGFVDPNRSEPLPATIYQPFSFVHAGWKQRRLITHLAWRKIEARYRGSVLGLFWTLIHPLLMLGVYTFVFSYVFRAKWNLPSGGQSEFAIYLFSGLIIYTIFSECANEAPGLMLANEVYIKQLIFPTEALAWVSLLAALFNFGVSLVLLIGFYALVIGEPPITFLYLPLVMGPLVFLTLGAVWLLSSLGLYLRDLNQIVTVLTTALLFLSPIFYSSEIIPEPYQQLYFLNPFASILEMSRGSIFLGTAPDWQKLGQLTLGAWFTAWIGYVWFMKTKGSFADVL